MNKNKKFHHSTRPLSMRPPFSWATHCILYTTLSTAESNMSPGMLITVRNTLFFKVINVWTPLRYTLDLKYPHRKKSHGVRSGENGLVECCLQDAMSGP
ncbi:hypothetical protein AVEN_180371-1 [Araneus ventricosus]|uniref:Uncharacterized protein n=1 Tax=Araneus ventricosus TaxID=182803 RepID=A0A4Y2QQR1_ARAVE|nr:hypothetical protein AVEN_180371-1 [Araneus ventricosus]